MLTFCICLPSLPAFLCICCSVTAIYDTVQGLLLCHRQATAYDIYDNQLFEDEELQSDGKLNEAMIRSCGSYHAEAR